MAVVVCAFAVGHVPLRAEISLTAVAPPGATAGVTLQVTGLGFAPTAADNEVILTPASGPAVTVPGAEIAVVNATSGLRRLTISVPAGLAPGTAGVQVRNRTTGEVAGGRTFTAITMAIPQAVAAVRGTTGVAVRIVGSENTQLTTGRTSVAIGSGVTVTAVNLVSATELVATVTVAPTAALGPRVVSVVSTAHSALLNVGFTVVDQAPPPNQAPVARANGPYAGTAGEPIAFSSAGSSDPDGDPLQFAWAFGDGGTSSDAHPQHTYTEAGVYTATLTVSDGRGGTAQDSAQVSIAAAPVITLDAIAVAPPSLFFSDLGATVALTVTGHYSDGSEQDLTAAVSGTTYATGDPFVAVVDAGGVVTSVANGQATITVSNSGLTTTVDVVVEQGVSLSAIELTPPIVTLRELGSTAQTTVRGIYSDDSIRDLTGDPQTTYAVDDEAIALVSATGLLTSVASGVTTLTASHRGFVATAQVRVLVTDGDLSGLLRGEAFDDSRGLPLANVTATVVTGSGPQVAVAADERGQFVLPATAGAALVRVAREGFTQVDRQGVVLGNTVTTLLDARLTPLDSKLNVLQSVFGGEASSADGSASIAVPPGGVVADTTLRVTPISNQGLAGLLPPGWSPIAAVDLAPAGVLLSQPATVRLLHADSLAPFAPVVLVAYDAARREWIAQPPGQVSADGRSIVGSIDRTGQFAFVVPDESPAAPPLPADGAALAGVVLPPVPAGATATGQVVPRSAPPGDDVRAVGAIVLQPPAPLPSGTVLRARVSEQFDLLDASRVLPQPFVQDLLVYQRPRLGDAGTLATRLPVTPSIQFSIQQLSIGTVLLDVTADEAGVAASVVGAGGGSVADAAGNVLEIPPGLLPADVAIGLVPLAAAQLSVAIPAGYTLLGAVLVDAVGVTFPQPVALSIVRPSGLDPTAQVLVAQVMTDSAGGRRLRIIGVGAVSAGRIAVATTVGSLTLDGVRGGGEFLFLQPADPHGFFTGTVTATGLAQALALVTADTAPFAFLTSATGAFVVAGRVGPETTVAAIEPTGAAASAVATLALANGVATLQLALTQTAPVVLGTSPAANAAHVALDTPIVIDFSKAIDPSTVTPSSVVLSTNGTTLVTQAVLSANQRRLTVTPAASLAGLTPYTLTLTAEVRDTAGIALAAFTPLTFTTLDPTKASILALGIVTATLPDEDDLTFITGAPGAAEPGTPVVATNLRTQETMAVLAAADGSFLVRVAVLIGDEVALTLRDASGRETTISITQFGDAGGPTSVGESGGTVQGPDGRVGRILPRALETAGVFQIEGASGAPAPALPASFVFVDRFGLSIGGASFRRLDTLTLSESQGRFQPASAFGAPFAAASQLTVPPDFLLTASLRFTATVSDREGTRRTASGATVVVGVAPDGTPRETGLADQFPTVFLTAPAQAVPTQVVEVSAIAPAARVDFDLPAGTAVPDGHTIVLARLVQVSGQDKLSAVDRLSVVDLDGHARLRTAGRELPGASRSGEYLAVSGPIAFITGRVNGPAAIVTADGSPFVYETDGANGAFILPVPAGTPFTLRFLDATTLALLGMASGQAPAPGATADLGQPLAPAAGTLRVTAQPDTQSIVDIGAPLVFTFSEPVDRASLTSNAVVVTSPAGARVFGRVTVSDDNRTVTFVPLRRWQFGTRYDYGVTTSVAAASGARLAQPFSGAFTTFTPRLRGVQPFDGAEDVAVAGSVGIVGTRTGFSVVDLTSGAVPAPIGSVAVAGGVRGVAMAASPFDDRNGQPVPVPMAVVAGGGDQAPGVARSYSLAVPASPVLLGSTQLTTPPGQAAPPGVPALSGVPNAVAVTAEGDAFVSVRHLGLQAVDLGSAIPHDAGNPGAALGPRVPPEGVADAVQAAVFGHRVAVARTDGLHVLEAVTLETIGSVSLGTALTSVAALTEFGVDFDGDGQADETVDLVVAGDATGVLHVYRVSPDGAPSLISAVRMPQGAAIRGVAVSAEEGLAYVGIGGAGLAFVDLTGAVSVQPLDLDHNGADDRILGLVDTPGTAGRVALDLSRGLAHVADGAAGLSVVQVLPPRVRFETLLRDPIRVMTGDEQSIMDTRTAFTTDDGLLVAVNAILPPHTDVRLVIDEIPLAGGTRLLSLDGGGLSAPVASGTTQFTLDLAQAAAAVGGGSLVTLTVQTPEGALAALPLAVTQADAGGAQLEALRLAPRSPEIPADVDSVQLAVLGIHSNGLALNLTTAATGTTYAVDDAVIASVEPDGRAVAVAGGRTTITVTNGTRVTHDRLSVDRPPALLGFETSRLRRTLTRLDASETLGVEARFSDGSKQPAGAVAGTAFTTSDAAVVTVDTTGVLTAAGDGLAVVTVANGPITLTVEVAVELRTPPVVTELELAPFAARITTDDARVSATATLSGAGSLEGLTVTFTVAGPGGGIVATALSGHGGVTGVSLDGFTSPGTFQVIASVVNPANGQVLTDVETLVVDPGTQDHEPNDGTDTASRLGIDRSLTGSLDGLADTSDTFRIDTAESGTFTASLDLAPGTDPSAVTLIARDADGAEIARFTPTTSSSRFTLPPTIGAFFLSITSTQAASYTLSSAFEQGPISIAAVVPASGGVGTLVRITGSGFSPAGDRTRVLFGGAMGRVESVTQTTIDVRVPATAVDGPLEVVSGARRATGPVFGTGTPGAPPPIYVLPDTDPRYRVDPISKETIHLRRFSVVFDPVVTRAEAESVGQREGAAIVGANPVLNSYVFELPSSRTVADIARIISVFEADPLVRYALPVTLIRPTAIRVDTRDVTPPFDGTQVPAGEAYRRAQVFEAIEAVRSTPPFDASPAPFHTVRVAVIDTGFDPKIPDDFRVGNTSVVTPFNQIDGQLLPGMPVDLVLCHNVPLPPPHTGTAQSCDGGHGTAVTSIIGAVNDGKGMSGVLNGLLHPGEPPFPIRTYATGKYELEGLEVGLDSNALENALAEVVRLVASAIPIDVVNLSYGTQYEGDTFRYRAQRQLYRDLLLPLAGRTLVVAGAGNGGVEAQFQLPSGMQDELSHVMAVGATAVADGDRTGELGNMRADFGGELEHDMPPCDPVGRSRGSNCGAGVTLAAPGEDVLMMLARKYPAVSDYWPQATAHGTSMSAPIVAGIAGIVQAIRTTEAPMPPDALRRLLVETALDISGHWAPGSMRMVNALAAVRAVLETPADQQHIYVSDNNAVDHLGRRGRLVAVNVDPMTGAPTSDPFDDREIPLSWVRNGQVFEADSPLALAVAPSGDKLYAIVTAHRPPLGEGVLVVSTNGMHVESFIAFSGEPLDAAAVSEADIQPAGSSGPRAGMVVSKDGRLLYVATGDTVTIVNLVEERVVRSLRDLPAPFYATELFEASNALTLRRQALQVWVRLAPAVGAGRMITGLTLSPDGRTLFATVSSGGGTGQQPGAALAIDVDLYRDAFPDTPGLQSALSTYFTTLHPIFRMANAGQPAGGDEPGAVAVSPDGNHLYLVNGGVASFEGVPPEPIDASTLYMLAGGPIFGAMLGAPAGFLGVATAITAFEAISPQVYGELRAGTQQILDGGTTLLSAPGFTGVFDASRSAATFGAQTFQFPGDVAFSWQPQSGGLLVNQTRFAEVFAKRPFGLAISPDGKRAVMPFFQTGNFGFLDVDQQGALRGGSLAAALPGTTFHGVVAVTRALSLDAHLWPRRGVLRVGGVTVPSPDERLLYPTTAVYAQNGRFAVAAHTGRLPFREITVALPDFQHVASAAALHELGFTLDGNTGFDPEGRPVRAGDEYTFMRGGGAISILDPTAMAQHVLSNRDTLVTLPGGGTRPYFSANPITETAVTHVFHADTEAGRTTLAEPRGVAIQPFVSIEAPRFGDVIPLGSSLQVRWRDSRVTHYRIEIYDISAGARTLAAGEPTTRLTPEQVQRRAASFGFADLFLLAPPPEPGRTYRVEIYLAIDVNGTPVDFSSTSVDVAFD